MDTANNWRLDLRKCGKHKFVVITDKNLEKARMIVKIC